MRPLYYIFLYICLLGKVCSAAEYGYLIVTDSEDSNIINLEKGDYLQILSSHNNDANGMTDLRWREDTNSIWGTNPLQNLDSYDADRLVRHFKAGQYQLQYTYANSGHRAEMSYKIVRKNEYIYENSNVAHFGTSVGDKTISVRTSNDLTDWTLSSSFKIDNTYQFIRVRTQESTSDYYTKGEVDKLIESNLTNAISLGQQDVAGNPSQYGLFTSSDLSDAQSSSRSEGQQDVIVSPSDYDLMGAEGVFDMRVSQPGISTSGDKASMNFTIQSSNDLEEWNNEETLRREYSMPSDKNFMRVSVGLGLEPQSLPAIATDTYGDKLVYDESNNLYVNDEDTPLKRYGLNLRTDTYPGWNFYAIESTSSGYLCLLKNANRNIIITFSQDGNYLDVSVITNLSAYESDFGQGLN